MRDVSFPQRTTTNPEKTCSFRDAACFGVTLRRILHEVADRAARTLNAGEAEDPPSRPVGLGENKSSWNPEKNVVVRPSALREFEDPLPPDLNALRATEVADVPDEFRDAFRRPLIIFTVRERNEEGIEPLPAPLEPAPCRVRRTDHHPTHPPDASFLVEVLKDLPYC